MSFDRHEKTVVCDCDDMEHIVRFTWWSGNDPQDDEVYIHYFLQNNKLFKRIINAIKYVFGFKSMYGHFGEVLINIKKTQELIVFLDEFVREKISDTEINSLYAQQ